MLDFALIKAQMKDMDLRGGYRLKRWKVNVSLSAGRRQKTKETVNSTIGFQLCLCVTCHA